MPVYTQLSAQTNDPDIVGMKDQAPRLFVFLGQDILEFKLEGRQTLGRPDEDRIPDLPIANQFVSREHGVFETVCEDGGYYTMYSPGETTNGIFCNGIRLKPEDQIWLQEGDVLKIPAGGRLQAADIMMIYAASEAKIQAYRGMGHNAKDSLTGLYGRGNLMSWWYRFNNSPQVRNAALFILDADDFKTINDTCGHAGGDQALQIIAREILATVDDENQACRWGGDEFIGIVTGTEEEAAKKLSDMSLRIRAAGKEQQLPLTVSIGCVHLGRAEKLSDFNEIVKMADQLLYQSKEKGKNRVLIGR